MPVFTPCTSAIYKQTGAPKLLLFLLSAMLLLPGADIVYSM